MGSYENNDCEVLDTTTPNASFQPLSTRPHKQHKPVVCVVNTDVYLLGGLDGNKMVQKYSTISNEWTILSKLHHNIDCSFPIFVQGNTIRIYSPTGFFLQSYTLVNAHIIKYYHNQSYILCIIMIRVCVDVIKGIN